MRTALLAALLLFATSGRAAGPAPAKERKPAPLAAPLKGTTAALKAADAAPSEAKGDPRAAKADPKADATAKAPPARKRTARELRLDEEFRVEGQIQKPTAFFILERQGLEVDEGDKKESFLPKIVKSTEKDPL